MSAKWRFLFLGFIKKRRIDGEGKFVESYKNIILGTEVEIDIKTKEYKLIFRGGGIGQSIWLKRKGIVYGFLFEKIFYWANLRVKELRYYEKI